MAHFLSFKRVDAEVGDDARGVAVVRAGAKYPRIVDVRKAGIRPADHRGNTRLGDRGGCRLDLRAADRPDDGGDAALAGQLGEGQYSTRVGAAVVFDAQFDLTTEHTARLVDLVLRELDAIDGKLPSFGLRAGDLVHNADLEGLGRAASGRQRTKRQDNGAQRH